MDKGGSSPPPPPDPALLAKLQGAENRKTLQYGLDNSRTSTVNPFGSTSWQNLKTFDQAGFDKAMEAYRTPTAGTRRLVMDEVPWYDGTESTPTTGEAPNREDFGGRDNWVNTQKLSPESQGIYDTATSKLSESLKNFGTDPDAYNQEMADAVYRRMRRYQDPADERERMSQQSNLADRGFQVGNEAYEKERTRLDDVQGVGRADAADRAQIAGFAQGQQKLNARQQIAQFLSNLRNQQVAGVSGMPTTTTTPSIQPFDIAGTSMRQYEGQLNAYNAEQASDSAMFGSLLGLGGMALGGPLGGSLAGALGGGGAALAGASALGSFLPKAAASPWGFYK